MSDLGREGVADEDRLPWLEPVDEDDVPQRGVAAGKLIGALVAALLAIGLVVGGSFWLRQRGTEIAGNAPVAIPAPAEPYKTKPSEPGGMQVPGQGDSTYAASAGNDPNAQLDLNAVAEAPLKAPGAAPATPPAAAPAPPPAPAKAAVATPPAKVAVVTPPPAAKPATPAPKPAPAKPAAAGPLVQLGAFSSEAKADAAWQKLSGRFSFLGSATKQVVSGTSGTGTVYRLRASGAGTDACAKLTAAGATCITVGK